jgi:hypothetical protein
VQPWHPQEDCLLSTIFLLDEYASHTTPRLIADAGLQKSSFGSSYIGHPLDLCVFIVFRMLYKREQKRKNEKRNVKDIGESICFCGRNGDGQSET